MKSFVFEKIIYPLCLNFIKKHIKGKLAGVINAVVIILRRSQESESSHKTPHSDIVKLLIPNNFVTKLIGASITYNLFFINSFRGLYDQRNCCKSWWSSN